MNINYTDWEVFDSYASLFSGQYNQDENGQTEQY